MKKLNTKQMTSVDIAEHALRKAHKLAGVTYKEFKNVQGHYRNTSDAHLRGKIGEVACVQWLEERGFKCRAAFENIDEIKSADIVVGNGSEFRVEVKTWNERYWDDWGRCASVKQFPSLKRKADAIIWCVTPHEFTAPVRVCIAGWNTIEDIEDAPKRLTGPESRPKINNYQLDPEKLRPLAELINRLPK